MNVLNYNEKILLIIYIVLILILVGIVVYLRSRNSQIATNKIHVIDTDGDNFVENYSTTKYSNPMISSNVNPVDWNNLVKIINNLYDEYNVFIIKIGKNALPYTASALSFMIENTTKPIILTYQNTSNALMIAADIKIPEVMVLVGKKLLRGCRVTSSLGNIISPYYPPLSRKTSLQFPIESPQIKYINPKISVGIVKTFPGVDITNIYMNLKPMD